MPVLRVHLFGGLALARDEEPLPAMPSLAARSLLAYLLTYRDRPHTRDLLAGTFWPDLPDTSARRRLSQALWHIRRALEPHPIVLAKAGTILVAKAGTIQLNPDLPLWLDVEAFRRRISNSENQAFAKAAGELLSAAGLYRGEFLAGYYDDWAVLEREDHRERFLEVLERLVAGYKAQGQYERALVYARRLAGEDPWREEAYQEAMRFCHLLGRDTEALKLYEDCREALAEELGVEPSPETEALAREIAARTELEGPPLLPANARQVDVPCLERPDLLPLVGRQAELAELLRRLEAAATGSGGLTVVTGEAGVGKSRLVREMAGNARWRGVETAWGRCVELSSPPAYQPLLEVLRDRLPALRGEALEPLWRAELSRLMPEMQPEAGPPPSLAPEEERRRLLEAITRAFLAMAGETPHLILLEDAHWMDPASLEALRYLLPRLVDVPLLVILTVRSEELAGQQAEILAAMERTRLAPRLELGRLDGAGSAELVQRALGLEQPAPRFSARLHAETEGNAFFLIETLWALLEEGLLYRSAEGAWSTPWDGATEDYAEMPLPAGIVQAIEHRLDRLPPALYESLSLAAVMGRQVDFAVWQAAGEVDESELLAAADQLCARGLLLAAEPRTAAGGDGAAQPALRADYAFAHHQIRRVTYGRLAGPRRSLYHRQVATALTSLAPDEPDALAHHWTQARVWDRAAAYHRQAGDRARRVYANAQALDHYTQALEALERLPLAQGHPRLASPELHYRLRLAREAVYDVLGAREAQIVELDGAQALAEAAKGAGERSIRWQAQVALRRSRLADTTGNYPQAISSAQLAVDLARQVQDLPLEATGLLRWAQGLRMQGDNEQAKPRLEEALALARKARRSEAADGSASSRPRRQVQTVEATALRSLGNIALIRGNYTTARTEYDQALVLFRALGDRRGESGVLSNLGNVYVGLGDYSQASAHYEEALHIYREIGDRWGEGTALSNLGNVAMDLGDTAGARAYLEQQLAISHEVEDLSGQGLTHVNLGKVSLDEGDYAQAKSHLEQAREILGSIGSRRFEGWALVYLGRLARHRGEYQAALKACWGAVLMGLEAGDRSLQAFGQTFLGHILVRMGHLEEAREAYLQALSLCNDLGHRNRSMEPLAGLARVALSQGDLDGASHRVEEILAHLGTGSLEGTEEPCRIYLACYRVLQTQQDPRTPQILEAGHELLRTRAEQLPEPEARRRFLEGVAVHRAILAAHAAEQPTQRGARPAPGAEIRVQLPRLDAPTGRPLREDEVVSVTWTVEAPEDEAPAGGSGQGKTPKVVVRRRRILRLLEQARSQGAAPREQDLATALGVSIPTIRRDIAVLRAQGHALPGRGRSRATSTGADATN